jgi:hypothetical protein
MTARKNHALSEMERKSADVREMSRDVARPDPVNISNHLFQWERG